MIGLSALFSVAGGLAKSLAAQFIGEGEFLKWISAAVDIFNSGVRVNERLNALADRIEIKLAAGEHFTDEDFAAVMKEIEDRDADWKAV